MISLVEAFTAAARRQLQDALGCAHATLAHTSAVGRPVRISHDRVRRGWPLAARTARDLGDADTASELLTMLSFYPRGHLVPILKADGALARARLSARDGDPAVAVAFAAAITSLRELARPTTSRTACLTTPGISSTPVMPRPPQRQSKKPAGSQTGCAASRCSTGRRI